MNGLQWDYGRLTPSPSNLQRDILELAYRVRLEVVRQDGDPNRDDPCTYAIDATRKHLTPVDKEAVVIPITFNGKGSCCPF
jgi:hypothetical protein